MSTSSESDKLIASEIRPAELDALMAAASFHRLLLENDRVPRILRDATGLD